MLKRITAILVSVLCIISIPTFAFATELTQEYIDMYGIKSIDEFGDDTIIIPLGNWNSGVETTALPDFHKCDMERHFSLTPHTHHMENINANRGLVQSKALTAYADEGFILTKEYSSSVTFTMEVDFKIPKAEAEKTLGITLGGSYTFGSSVSYTAPAIPEGYLGRIAYRVKFDYYIFDDRITYVYDTIPLTYYDAYEYNCSAESAPYDGYFYLELKAK